MKNFKKLFLLLTYNERKQAGLLVAMITIMALLDMIGVASILPFMAVLTNTTLIETNSFLNFIFQKLNIYGVKNNDEFLFVIGIFVLVLLVLSLTFKALTTYAQVRFVQMREYSICRRLIEGYLHQPYSWFLSRHSADLGKTILSEVAQIIGNGMRPLVELVAKGMIAIAIISLLILVNPKLALIVGILLSSVYGLIFYFARKYLNLIGSKRLKNNQLRFESVSEAFGAVKEVKVGGLEEIFVRNFSNAAQIFAKSQSASQAIAQLPRFILEAISFGGVLLIILFMMRQTGNFNDALPIISLYVFAGYRLLPAMQQIYGSFTQLAFVGPSLDKLYNDLKNLRSTKKNQDGEILLFNKKIELKNICYNYPDTSRTALKNINLNIYAKSIVGLVGATGSGKSTIVDIILGLLEAQEGTLEVDGKIITNLNSRSWQKSIGYVPQHIFLTDDTIAANIAFGLDPKDIKTELIEKASKIANLHNFVIDELTNQYQTKIGERGVRLSGGQRQRIGIARALYNNPRVLILDEATSALDEETEKKVMNAINNLRKDITIILITHRLNTVKICDKIFKINKGKLETFSSYDNLISNN